MTEFTLLIRAFDADSTFVSFRWLDDPGNPEVHAIASATLVGLMARLDAGLIGGDERVLVADQVRAATSGPLTRSHDELAICVALAHGIFPDGVRGALRNKAARGNVHVRITPSRALARVPFELLVVDHPRRLVELADVSYEPPAAIHLGRGRVPEPWDASVARRPVIYVVDPKVPGGAGLKQIISGEQTDGLSNASVFSQRIAESVHSAGSGVGKLYGRWELSDELRARPGRLVYFGHVSATLDAPGSASLHLSDDGNEWGLTARVNDAHLPLSALDLLVGTSVPELGPDDRELIEDPAPGHELWPMPPRVAVIACEGGVDYRSSETFGLVMAMFSAGTEVLTTTRWTLPSDEAFRVYADVTGVPGPTTELAIAVDATHRAVDPVAALAQWQRLKLEQWRADPGPATSPLTWASVGCHVCPPRPVRLPNGPSVDTVHG